MLRTPTDTEFASLTKKTDFMHAFPKFTDYALPSKALVFLDHEGFDLLEVVNLSFIV